MPTFGIVDLFAGPGGLGEGFASVMEGDHAPFQMIVSVEKETSAHRTLTLRSFLREYRSRHGSLPEQYIAFHGGSMPEPDWSHVDADAWEAATSRARALELGTTTATTAIDTALSGVKGNYDDMILIGGPPCQAYSVVGRARVRGSADYVPEQDERHYLFREYIRVLDGLRPAVFVMENVRGILSSRVESRLVFEMLVEDLTSLGTRGGHHYELCAIRVENGRATLQCAVRPADFVVRAEEFGLPQRRHRVIIIGIRSDLVPGIDGAQLEVDSGATTVRDAIGSLPRLRSGISRGADGAGEWRGIVVDAAERLAGIYRRRGDEELEDAFSSAARGVRECGPTERSASLLPEGYGRSSDHLSSWLEQPELQAIAQHETRGHMPSDLTRYLFTSVFGAAHRCSPRAAQFPPEISPNHRNWHSGVFSDRFRVQLAHDASTTITSHISKDGHYFIHYDPVQCRSLTVREAARLQTFPDDYLFLGNRSQQYVQIGNAVPPLLAHQIAKLLVRVLGNTRSHGDSGAQLRLEQPMGRVGA